MDYFYQLIDLIKRWSSYLGFTNEQSFEDTFYQLLHDKKYDDALKLAQQYKYLDIDLVYKCRWRNSGITVQSIISVLSNIRDKLWAINECVQTVPISYEACRTLIDFGLEVSNLRLLYQLGDDELYSNRDSESKHGPKGRFKAFSARRNRSESGSSSPFDNKDLTEEDLMGLIDFDHLNDGQKELCRCRRDLLHHKHSLLAYQNTLGDHKAVQQHFDHVFYDEFRRKSPLENCLDFAHESDSHAVETMLNFYKEELKPHLLAILSNFPETSSPYQYRNLLPCLRKSETLYEWRPISSHVCKEQDSDWSNQVRDAESSFSVFLRDNAITYEQEFYENNQDLKKYLVPFTDSVLTEWFKQRSLEMESRTLLLSSAIQLLDLGSELNIKNLEKTRDDLAEFDRIIYDCCAESNIYLSLNEFNQMSIIERIILITGDSLESEIRFRYYVIPYLQRRDSELGLTGKATILRDYFVKLAHKHEHICRRIFNNMLDNIGCDKEITDWTAGLDYVIDDIGERIHAIERGRDSEKLSTLASQTMALGDYTDSYRFCQVIMKKDYKERWPLCCQLGMNKEFKNSEAKYELLAFALAYCDDPDGKMSAKILDYIIDLRKRDERIQLVYLKRQQN